MSLIEVSIIGVLVLAALIGAWRVFRGTRPWRWTRVLGNLVMASLLYLLIFPPAIEQPRETGIVLTPGATTKQIDTREHGVPTLALPGIVTTDRSIVHVPDLASGLRQHPEIGDLRVLGDGLPARDREAVENRGLTFKPGDEALGIVELRAPDFIRAGAVATVRGRASGIENAQLRLLGRSDAVTDSASTDSEGRFTLSVRAKAAGESLYRLQLLDDKETLIDEIPVPVVVVAGDSTSVLILAGGPDAELKYLRRWIIDSGNTVASRISLSRGIEQNQNGISLSAESLAKTDLLIVDERAWAGLAGSDKTLIRTAVENGLGMLFRVTGALPARVASDWKAYGFDIQSADVSRSVTLAKPLADVVLTRPALQIIAEDSVPLAVAVDGSRLAAWRAVDQGRVGSWLPLDSYRLQLDGEATRYGSIWSNVFANVSRARGHALPSLPMRPRVDERSTLCDLKPGASIEDAENQQHDLLVDATTSCAAWWPEKSGWYRLVNADLRWPLYVYAAGDIKTLAKVERHEATSRLVKSATGSSSYRRALPRWPLFLIWLLASGLFWWLERRFSR